MADHVAESGAWLSLRGLDGANPLAFLAALGVLRLATVPDEPRPRMRWAMREGRWTPLLSTGDQTDADLVLNRIGRRLGLEDPKRDTRWYLSPQFGGKIYKNLKNIPPAGFRDWCLRARSEARLFSRDAADFLCAYGCESVTTKSEGAIAPTKLHFIDGTSRQNYLETAKNLHEFDRSQPRHIKESHLRSALLEIWKYEDNRLGFRWDPADLRQHALMADDPSPLPTQTVWGANLLAFHGTTLLPSFPVGNRLATVGFLANSSRQSMRWPIWEPPATLDVTRTVLGLTAGDLLSELKTRGVVQIFESDKVQTGESGRAIWSSPPARAVGL